MKSAQPTQDVHVYVHARLLQSIWSPPITITSPIGISLYGEAQPGGMGTVMLLQPDCQLQFGICTTLLTAMSGIYVSVLPGTDVPPIGQLATCYLVDTKVTYINITNSFFIFHLLQ